MSSIKKITLIEEDEWIEGTTMIRTANKMLNSEEKEKLLRLIEAFLTLAALDYF